MTSSTLAARYSWIANQLNREAYRQQMERRRSPLKHFYPCPKALQFTAALNLQPLQPSSVLIYAAALTPCDCHPGSGALELEALYESSIEAIPNE